MCSVYQKLARAGTGLAHPGRPPGVHRANPRRTPAPQATHAATSDHIWAASECIRNERVTRGGYAMPLCATHRDETGGVLTGQDIRAESDNRAEPDTCPLSVVKRSNILLKTADALAPVPPLSPRCCTVPVGGRLC
ncbi:hypothetical protein DDE01_27780 [Desulfovibrio desulfuricans]|nr:hypothetical protein DDE01_27780 [Desulfovibrio desulfuricans]